MMDKPPTIKRLLKGSKPAPAAVIAKLLITLKVSRNGMKLKCYPDYKIFRGPQCIAPYALK